MFKTCIFTLLKHPKVFLYAVTRRKRVKPMIAKFAWSLQIVLLSLCFAGGCNNQDGASTMTPVPITGAKFLKTDVKVEDFYPSASNKPVDAALIIPGEKIPKPSTADYGVKGRDVIAVVTQQRELFRGVYEQIPNGIQLFNKKWRAFGPVSGLPFYSKQVSIESAWNQDGNILAIHVSANTDNGMNKDDIGIVDLKTRHFQRLLSLEVSRSISMVWADNQLYISSMESKNGAFLTTIIRIDPLKRQVKEMYREKIGRNSGIWI